MTNRDVVLSALKTQGKADALDLRSRAPEMDGTGLIDEEEKIPVFVPNGDYSGWPRYAPVKELVDGEYQVFTWITPVNTAHYPGFRPSVNRAECSLCHTKDPAKAKSWVDPLGTSGMYELGECYKEADGRIFRQTYDGKNEHRATVLPERWEEVI